MHFEYINLLSNHIRKQYEFYIELLGMKGEWLSDSSFRIHLPRGELHFSVSPDFKPNHFAFNIPPFSEKLALEWLSAKVMLLKFGGKPIVNFDNWNARSLYFHDPDQNIVEFIARRNLNFDQVREFSAADILEINELGLPTTDIQQIFMTLHNKIGLPIYDGDLNEFCAIGTETGLFITVNREKKKWFPTNEEVYPAEFSVQITYQGTWHTVILDDTNLKID